MTGCAVCGRNTPEGQVTCGRGCHEIYVNRLEAEFGKDKKVVDAVTGKAYRVPIRYIVENGLKQTELSSFPEWSS